MKFINVKYESGSERLVNLDKVTEVVKMSYNDKYLYEIRYTNKFAYNIPEKEYYRLKGILINR